MGYRVAYDESGNWIAAHGENFPPSGASVPLNTRFYRTDVRELHYWNGTGWIRDPADLPGGGSGPTVQESDGSPSEPAVSNIQLDQADGFVLTVVAPGEVRIDLSGIPQDRVSGLVAALAAKEDVGVADAAVAAHEAAANPHPTYATDADLAAHVAAADPHTGYQRESEKNAANGYAGLNGSSKLTGSQQVYGAAANTACEGNDARLSDARSPLAHSIIGAAHSGFPGGGTTFLRDDGTFAAPPAGGSPPTGTGFRHVTAGVEDAAAKLVDTADVNNNQITYAKIQDVSATDRVLGRSTAGAGDVEEIACTAAGRALIDDATAGDQRTTLGLGTIATANSPVPIANGGTGQTTAQAAIDALTNVAAATNEHVLTKDTASGNAVFKAAPGGGTGASITRIAGDSGAAGADLTYQYLTANSADITVTTPTVVLTTTGVGAGWWMFKYILLYQSSLATCGIGLCVNHTGTTGKFSAGWRHFDGSSAGSSGSGDNISTAAAGGVVGGYVETVKNTVSVASVSVTAINADVQAILEGFVEVTASGDLELKLRSELAGTAVRLIMGSMLELVKIA
jgi:hypothetical protein